MGWKKKSALIAGILLVLYTINGFLILPLIAESILPDRLSGHLNRPVVIENISLNPYTLALSLEGLEVREKSGKENFIAFDRFFVNLQWSSLFKLSLVSKAVRLENPLIRVARLSDKTFNFSDLIPAGKKEPKPAPEKKQDKAPLRFSLSNISLSGGTFIFRDGPMDQTHHFTNIHFSLPRLSNFKSQINDFAEPLLAGNFNDTQLQVDASTKPFADSLETVIDVSLSGISLPPYFDYAPVPLGFSVANGSLDVKAALAFTKEPEGKSRLEVSGTADFSDLRLVDPISTEILAIPAVHIEMAPSEVLQKKIRMDTFRLTEPTITLVRHAGGELNLAQLGPPAADAPEQAKKSEPDQAAEPAPSPFSFKLKHFHLDSGTIRFRDFAAPQAQLGPQAGPLEMRLETVDLKVSDFSNRPGDPADIHFSAKLPPDASLSMAGKFATAPLAGDVGVEVKNLGLNRAQAYFPQSLNLLLSKGRLDLSGNARCRTTAQGNLSAQFAGNAGISELALVEKKTGRDLTNWKAFDVNGMDLSWNPTRANIEEISVAGFEQQVVLEKDGSLNLNHIYGKKPKEVSEARRREKAKDSGNGGGGPGFPVSIGELKLSDINFLFTDYHIQPTYAARLTLEKGSIKGLSTEEFKGARVSIKGAVNEHAPMDIAGRINPLLEAPLLDLRFNLQNLETAPFSAYSGKYIGRAIEKGKLNLNLDYEVENKKLEAENELLLDQFTLGPRIESDTALNLPVGLAVALLKNRKGLIDLDLPVSGRLDDPEFSLTGIVLQSLRNIITKAATSPFSLVSSIVSGGEELRYIEFPAGLAELTDTGREKLASMQKLLYERPNLNLELTGYVSREEDRQALVDQALERKIRAAKAKAMKAQKGTEKDEIEAVEPGSEAYRQTLREVYKAEVRTGPDAAEDAKPLSDASLTEREMKEMIRQRISIPDSELWLLTQERVKQVKDFILRDERISGKRLFIRKAESLSPPEPGEFKESRVELNLK